MRDIKSLTLDKPKSKGTSKKPRSSGKPSSTNHEILKQLQEMAKANSSRPGSKKDDLLTARLERKEKVFNQLENVLSQLQDDQSITTEAWKQKLDEIEQLEHDNETLTAQFNALHASHSSTSQDSIEMKAQMTLLSEENDSKAREIAKLNDTMCILNEDFREQTMEWMEKEGALKVELDEIKQENEDLKLNIGELSQNYNALSSQHEKLADDLTRELERFKEERMDLNRTIETMKKHTQVIEDEKTELTTHLRGASKEIEQLKQEEKHFATCTRQFEVSKNQFTVQLESAVNENEALQTTIDDLRRQMEERQEEIQYERQTKQDLNSELDEEIQKYADELEAYQQREIELKALHLEETRTLKRNFDEAMDQTSALERRLKGCTGEIEDLRHATSVRSDENEKLRKVAAATLDDMEELRSKYDVMKKQRGEMKVEKEELMNKNRRIENALKHLCVALGRKGCDYLESLENWVDEAQQRLNGVEALQNEYDSLRTCSENQIQEQVKAIKELETRLDSKTRESEEAKSDAAMLAKSLTELQETVVSKERTYDDEIKKTRESQAELERTLGADVLKFQRSVENSRERIQALESEKMELLEEAECLNTEMKVLRQEKGQIEDQFEQLRATSSSLGRQFEETIQSKKEMEENVKSLEEKNISLQKEVQEKEWLSRQEILALEKKLQEKENDSTRQKEVLEQQVEQLARDLETKSGESVEIQNTLEEKRLKLEEAAHLVVTLRDELANLNQNSTNEELRLRRDLEAVQQQTNALSLEKGRLEVALTAATAQQEQFQADMASIRQDKKIAMNSLHDMDQQLVDLRTSANQATAELERMTKSRNQTQDEAERVTKEYNDLLRQFEVTRRNYRTEKAKMADEIETLGLELSSFQQRMVESSNHASELQSKLASVQNSANATINELMMELKTMEEAMRLERGRSQKESEKYRNQLLSLEDEISRREGAHTLALQALRQENKLQCEIADDALKKNGKIQQQLDSRRKEIEKMTQELQENEDKWSDLSRSSNSLRHAKQLADDKIESLKQTIDSKTKEFQATEDELTRQMNTLKSEKRDLEVSITRLREQVESGGNKSSTEQQAVRDYQILKSTLERTKAELIKTTNDLEGLHSRLDSTQQAANATISDLKTQLVTIGQGNQTKMMEMERELDLERERRTFAENEKVRMWHMVRNKMGGAEDINWDPTTTSTGRRSTVRLDSLRPETISARSFDSTTSSPPSSTLADMPLSLIKAQVDIDIASPVAPDLDDDQGTRLNIPELELSLVNNNSPRGRFLDDHEYDRELANEFLEKEVPTKKGSRPKSGAKSKMKSKKTMSKSNPYGAKSSGKKKNGGLPKIST